MTLYPSIEEYSELVDGIRKVIDANKIVDVYASARDLDLLFQPGAQHPDVRREPRVVGHLKAGEKMTLTGLKLKVAEYSAVQICKPLSGWVDASKIQPYSL